MDFKRNIFESSAKMPERNETVSAAFCCREDAGYMPRPMNIDSMMPMSDWGKLQHNVRHVRSPRVGEQK